ncbi:late secretory pathway protein AVL9 homolog [Lutzomyia longipalpis]|uniref:late secretory pathway protein AVL9 homolog n=1 Tax=Lutzomyia longipalpis TaxID=7200 RepID=UPI002483E627|nr:late secretory pathway protein AVL9 homolog [Lutzomyia longipalpis]
MPPILHILVVGFHHKKGCQVEFSHPPLIEGTTGKNECPSGWKYLPTLALPDGSHNFTDDTVFFNLPSLTDPKESVYGVSCYRQIPAERLKIKTADVTRSTVQKAVCALMSYPIYGYVEVKLSLIAQCFFDQGDFSSVDILVNVYEQLNACLTHENLTGTSSPERYYGVGLNLREIILKWRHKILLIFKMMLLQRKVIIFGSPVRPICNLIIAVASLHPHQLTKGFREVACIKTSRPMSPLPEFPPSPSSPESHDKESSQEVKEVKEGEVEEEVPPATNASHLPEENEGRAEEETNQNCEDNRSMQRDTSGDTLFTILTSLSSFDPGRWGAPLELFMEGHLVLPYLSLPYMDLLSDPSVCGFTIGASNILFQQKRQLADVLIDVETTTIDVASVELRKQLQLSTEDLRFADYIIRNVLSPKEAAEGSEQWIKAQFQGYMLALLRASQLPDGTKELDHFNATFMAAWRKTHNWLVWHEKSPLTGQEPPLAILPNIHPFAGSLSVTDMKLKLAHTIQSTESGRKLNQAVNTTSKAVGGALMQAKGAFSTWWSTITTPPPQSATKSQDAPPPRFDRSSPEKPTEETQSNKSEEDGTPAGKVEVAKEAELIDYTRDVGDIFTI